jgi:hypothetical protein
MDTAWSLHNAELPLDVNGSGTIEPLDVLTVINYLNGVGVTSIPAFPDVDNDENVSPFDVLQIINHLNGVVAARPAASDTLATSAVGAALTFDDEGQLDESPALTGQDDPVDSEAQRAKQTDVWVSQVESLFKS